MTNGRSPCTRIAERVPEVEPLRASAGRATFPTSSALRPTPGPQRDADRDGGGDVCKASALNLELTGLLVDAGRAMRVASIRWWKSRRA